MNIYLKVKSLALLLWIAISAGAVYSQEHTTFKYSNSDSLNREIASVKENFFLVLGEKYSDGSRLFKGASRQLRLEHRGLFFQRYKELGVSRLEHRYHLYHMRIHPGKYLRLKQMGALKASGGLRWYASCRA